jgi:hypothetical protein
MFSYPATPAKDPSMTVNGSPHPGGERSVVLLEMEASVVELNSKYKVKKNIKHKSQTFQDLWDSHREGRKR